MNKFLDDIRFIMPLVNGFVNEPLQESGYDIKSPYYGNSFFPRVLREMHFRLGLPFKCIWFNNANVLAMARRENELEKLQSLYPNKIFIAAIDVCNSTLVETVINDFVGKLALG